MQAFIHKVILFTKKCAIPFITGLLFAQNAYSETLANFDLTAEVMSIQHSGPFSGSENACNGNTSRVGDTIYLGNYDLEFDRNSGAVVIPFFMQGQGSIILERNNKTLALGISLTHVGSDGGLYTDSNLSGSWLHSRAPTFVATMVYRRIRSSDLDGLVQKCTLTYKLRGVSAAVGDQSNDSITIASIISSITNTFRNWLIDTDSSKNSEFKVKTRSVCCGVRG